MVYSTLPSFALPSFYRYGTKFADSEAQSIENTERHLFVLACGGADFFSTLLIYYLKICTVSEERNFAEKTGHFEAPAEGSWLL